MPVGEHRVTLPDNMSWDEYNGLRSIQDLVNPYHPDRSEIRINIAAVLERNPTWIAAFRAGFNWISRVLYAYDQAGKLIRRRSRGKTGLSPGVEAVAYARQLRSSGVSLREVAETIGWSYGATQRACKGITVKRKRKGGTR